MKLLLRLLPLPFALVLLVLVFQGLGVDPLTWFDGRALSFTFFVPWIALALTDELRAPWTALCEGLADEPEDLPAPRRRRTADRLRALMGTTIAAGLAASLCAVFGGLNAAAHLGGQLTTGFTVVALGGAVLGPIYALLLAALLYGPLAARVEGDGSGLGAELDEAD